MGSHHPQCRTVIIIDKDLNANSLSKHLNKKLVEECDGDFPQLKRYEGSGMFGKIDTIDSESN